MTATLADLTGDGRETVHEAPYGPMGEDDGA
jgi:hypothetical protein